MTPPTPEQLANLRRLAQAATPGPWYADRRAVQLQPAQRGAGGAACPTHVASAVENADAAFIAALSPDVVLGLLKSIEFWSVCCRGAEEVGRGLLADRDALRARVAELEAERGQLLANLDADELNAARALGRAEERADVVAWLRSIGLVDAAARIEQGRHVRGGGEPDKQPQWTLKYVTCASCGSAVEEGDECCGREVH